MESMSERIVALRKGLKLSQEAFGRKIGLSRSEVRNIEYGITKIKELTIPIVCQAFNVDEKWLRTGEGDSMFVPIDRDEEFDQICTEIQLSNDEFIKDIMRKYWRLDDSSKTIIRKMLSGLSE